MTDEHSIDPTDPRLLTLSALSSPIWVTLRREPKIIWANRAGLAFWQVENLDELRRQERDPTRTTLDQFQITQARVEQGKRVNERWTLYPNGQPVRCRLTTSPFELGDGNKVMLVEAQPTHETEEDVAGMRAIEALRYTSALISIYSELGYLLMHNPAAQRAFGEQQRFEQRFVDSKQALKALNMISQGQEFETLIEAKTTEGIRKHQLHVKSSLDPVTGQRTLLVHAQDMTRAKAQDARLNELEELTRELIEVLSSSHDPDRLAALIDHAKALKSSLV